MTPIRVGLVGATGETGNSIVNALIEAGEQKFQIIALTRPSSLNKPANLALKSRGVELRAQDLSGPHEDLVNSLSGIDILVCAIGAPELLAQKALVTAAKVANIKRFVPCAFLPVIPAGGIHFFRDQKQEVYDLIFQLGLPYTIIDVGWWYQISLPHLPSGRTDAHAMFGKDEIAGDGNVASALTDLRDIGRYTARIIADDRTLNKWVFVYNELWSQNRVFGVVEQAAGEKVERTYLSGADLLTRIAEASNDALGMMAKIPAQYMYSWGIRGDNTPEYAKYLGYVTSKELYPDFEFTPLESYVDEVLSGQAKTVYNELRARSAAMSAADPA
jgi:uncharacterized protein YbjT (DUF2867 family)